MNSTAQCPQCGRLLPGDAPSGVCPQCLLGIGMQATSHPDKPDRRGGFTPPKPHQLAQHFPQLEILDLIGHGGMGAVYKARQRGLDRMVALKILPPEVSQDPAFAERFSREARALARLSHPNIVVVHDSGSAGGLYYLLMEYVDGINLREAIQTNELTPAEALAIVPQICEALQYAHDEGVVHRDIKPENILLDKKGRVKIADFGLARLLGQAADNFTLTGTHQVMGTPRYMAPEQMEGSHEVDHRADIYSLGVVFYEMLTGELPLGRFDAPSQKIQLDVRIDDVVLRTLQKEPSRRYQKASEIKTDVEAISAYANLSPRMRHMQGCDYRTKAELFGWPLLHVATGIDPKTGRKRVAKGIIAIGDVAVGGVALGGAAIGVFASGGAAVGLFTFAGAAVGILVAIGGAAAGLGISCGGCALGSIAMGGVAVGYFAFGGVALAVHGLSGMGRDPAAVDFFEPWADGFMTALPIFTTLGVFVMIFGMQLTISIAKRHSPQSSKPPREQWGHERSRGVGCATVGCLLLLICGGCVSIAVVIYLARSSDRVQTRRDELANAMREQARAIENVKIAREHAQRHEDGHLQLTDRGPALNEHGVEAFRLRADQIPLVNHALQTAHQAYLAIERLHTTHETNDLAHQVVTIKRFTDKELGEIEAAFWTEMDIVLDVEQQRLVRNNLQVHVDERNLASSSKRWKTGVLGWASHGAVLEIWKVGTWYHWQVETTTTSFKRFTTSDKSPELPIEFARFWMEETEAERSDPSSNPSIDIAPDQPQE